MFFFITNDVFAEQRKAESSKIKHKYPERIPVSTIFAPDIMKNEHNLNKSIGTLPNLLTERLSRLNVFNEAIPRLFYIPNQ